MPFFLCLLLLLQGCLKQNHLLSNQQKVIRLAAPMDIKSLDPIYGEDFYSGREVAKVFEGLLEYNYLKRPYQLQGNIAQDLPQVSADGLTYTFKLRPKIFFHDDSCFELSKGIGRELTAQDVRYTILRNASAFEQSSGWWMLEGRVLGLDKWREKGFKRGSADYDDAVEGLEVLDSSTLRIKLHKRYPQFLYALAMPYYFIVPRECVEFYKKEFHRHPVGSGPFRLKEYRPKLRLVYERHPNYRPKYYPSEASPQFIAEGLLRDRGERIPFLDKVIVEIVEQAHTRFLKFDKGDLDLIDLPQEQFSAVLTPTPNERKLRPQYADRGIKLNSFPQINLSMFVFNYDLPLFKNKKLRQAFSLAYDSDEENRLFFNQTGLLAQALIPPALSGYEADYVNPYRQYNLEAAKMKLIEAGYPGGKGLPEILLDTLATSEDRQRSELFKKRMADIGVKVQVVFNTWPDLLTKISKRNVMIFRGGWSASYPDAQNFFALFYSGNAFPGINSSRYSDATFDAMYLQSFNIVNEAERTTHYQKMNRYLGEEMPVIFNLHHRGHYLLQPHLRNFLWSSIGVDQMLYVNTDSLE